MLGNILVMIRQEYPYPPEKIDKKFVELVDRVGDIAAKRGLEMGLQHYRSEIKNYSSLLEKSQQALSKKEY